jgi:MFS family permease
VRAAVQALVAALLLTHHMTLPLFLVTGGIFGAASAFFAPASDGLVPQTVSSRNLLPANALLTLSRNVLNVFGPALSGALIAVAGTGWVFAVDSASFVASGIFLVRLKVPPYEPPRRSRFVRDLREGFREVFGRPWVRWPIASFAISNFCLAAFIVLGPPTFAAHFDGARDWGIASACGGAGAIAGALLSARLRPVHPLTACFLVSILLALPIAALAKPLPFPVVAAGWLVGSAAIALGNTWWETMLQRRIPASMYARVRSYDILVSFVFMPLGFVVFPLLARWLGYPATLLIAAGAVALSNLLVAFSPSVSAVRDEPLELA